jgi:hypothetical protein
VSFGTPGGVKTAQNNLAGTSNLALNTTYPAALNQLFPLATNQLFPSVMAGGRQFLGAGMQNLQPGVNFFNTMLGGNAANTAAALAPSINQTLQGIDAARTAAAGLTPRGGGRFGSLYGLSFAPQAQVQNLFNQARLQAAQTLPGIGLQQAGLGANLFGLGAPAIGAGTGALGAGTGALQAATGANVDMAQIAQAQQAATNRMWQSLGQGILGLATLPFGGGAAAGGLLGLIGQGGGGGGGFTGLNPNPNLYGG